MEGEGPKMTFANFTSTSGEDLFLTSIFSVLFRGLVGYRYKHLD